MDEFKEYEIVKCSHCGLEKKRIQDGRFPCAKEKKWVGEDGKLFNGLTCSECVVEKAKLRKRNNLAAKKLAGELKYGKK
jgi:hypothetical protein